MIPGNVDPRRPDKVQRYKPPTANANGQGEDLTPDYMNILGQRTTAANASTAAVAESTTEKHLVDGNNVNAVPAATVAESHHHTGSEEAAPHQASEDTAAVPPPISSNATNVIPTSPQYGVAIIPTNVSIADLPTETVTISTDTVIDTTAKQPPDDSKDIHSTPSRNDRFKVVKIASLEPFKRGRWKCMDYVDEAPPPVTQPNKVTQSTTGGGSISVPTGGVYLQTQSLPQQQIQQMLLQSGFTNGTQFFPNVQAQMIPQTQYFYPPGANMQTQTLPPGAGAVPSSMPAQFINSQPYFATGVVQNSGFAMPNYQNVQYVPANILQNPPSSAFVPTSQTVQLPPNFQQSQTYGGQPNVTAPMVNGHAFPPQQSEQQPQQVTSSSLPTQAAKSVILNTNVQQPTVVSQAQISQPTIQNQIPVVQNSTQSQSVPVIQQNQQQYQQQPNANFQQMAPPPSQTTQNSNQIPANLIQNTQVFDQTNQTAGPPKVVPVPVFDQNQAPQIVTVPALDKNQASNVYTNPQFDMNVNSLTVLENPEATVETVNETNSGTEVVSDNPDDPSKTNPVVNAIDNKIEQAMDLVKSHLMYTVREEVEVLKEKIAELMERIQQLETENNFLRSQIPKSQTGAVPAVSTPILTTSTPIVIPTTTTTTTSTAPPNETGQQQQQQ